MLRGVLGICRGVRGSAMSWWDPGSWGAHESMSVCGKGWQGVLGMLCSLQVGPCPCTVLPVIAKSQ